MRATRYTAACLLICWLALASGCMTTTSFVVSVDALAKENAKSLNRVYVVSGNENEGDHDLRFQEFKKHIETALRSQGFTPVNSQYEADVIIYAIYSVGDAVHRDYAYSIPTYGQTGVSSATTYGTFSGNSYSGTTYFQPTYGITGSTTYAGTITQFPRSLGLYAIDAKQPKINGEPNEYWRVFSFSLGSSSDLRFVFPYLITAAAPYLGESTTGGAIETRIPQGSKQVSDLLGAGVGTPPREE